jgi:hypothetical protein
VTAYSGYKANERPLSFTIDDQRLEIKDIICRWSEPEKDFSQKISQLKGNQRQFEIEGE